ncbi:hypothetical protein DCO58_07480 [Helicobacter saguini]|uniref:Uncharacterized protein n=1 Tax=Helicobacter saguini TaxID=1548018 RepID=A0A347VNC0_9HELI|nr:hypothetical protein [Helicobacter saguini]MWV61825.1 hypothetical protein [Helicobacter saguini]MWV67500.1 hypothetical protein [Helicobacter saguini]MWV69851.1 hypothetical protein [Helicobacter saguini]MWV72931.1 hypothetical protein [Helicobacter saguini]TLD95685.1 hypothetical protein LS64_002200 [Helicobacter saguini]
MSVKITQISFKYNTNDIKYTIDNLIYNAKSDITFISNHYNILYTKIDSSTLENLLVKKQKNIKKVYAYFYNDIDSKTQTRNLTYKVLQTDSNDIFKNFLNSIKNQANKNKKQRLLDLNNALHSNPSNKDSIESEIKTIKNYKDDIFSNMNFIDFDTFNKEVKILNKNIIAQLESNTKIYDLSLITLQETKENINNAFDNLLSFIMQTYKDGNNQKDKNLFILISGLLIECILFIITSNYLSLAITTIDMIFQMYEYHKNNKFFEENKFYFPLIIPILESFFTQVSYGIATCTKSLSNSFLICDNNFIMFSNIDSINSNKYIMSNQVALSGSFTNIESKEEFISAITQKLSNSNIDSKSSGKIFTRFNSSFESNSCYDMLQKKCLGGSFLNFMYIQHPFFTSQTLATLIARSKSNNETSKTSKNYLFITNSPARLINKTAEYIYTSSELLNFKINGRPQINDMQKVNNANKDYSKYDLEKRKSNRIAPLVVSLSPFARIARNIYEGLKTKTESIDISNHIPIASSVNSLINYFVDITIEPQAYKYISKFFQPEINLNNINKNLQNIRKKILSNTNEFLESLRTKKDLSYFHYEISSIFIITIYLSVLKQMNFSLIFKGEFLEIKDMDFKNNALRFNFGIANYASFNNSNSIFLISKLQKKNNIQDNICLEELIESFESFSFNNKEFVFENLHINLDSNHVSNANVFSSLSIISVFESNFLNDEEKASFKLLDEPTKKSLMEIILDLASHILKDSFLFIFPLPQYFINNNMQELEKNAIKLMIILSFAYNTKLKKYAWLSMFGIFSNIFKDIYKHFNDNTLKEYAKHTKTIFSKKITQFKSYYKTTLQSNSNNHTKAIKQISLDSIKSISFNTRSALIVIFMQNISKLIINDLWKTHFEKMKDRYEELEFIFTEKYNPPYAIMKEDYVYYPLEIQAQL